MKPMRLFGVLLLCSFGAAHMASLVNAQASVPLVATEAPAGFDRQTNGQTTQAEFVELEQVFARKQAIAGGVGPVYNAVSCADCHENPVIGGNSQVFEVRAGHFANGVFTAHPGGSLVHSRAIDAAIQERVLDGNEVRAFRASTSVLGLGFVEAIRTTRCAASRTHSRPSRSASSTARPSPFRSPKTPDAGAPGASAGRHSRRACSRSRATSTSTRSASRRRCSRWRTP